MRQAGDHPFKTLVAGSLFAWGAWETQHWLDTEWMLAPMFLALCAALHGVRFAIQMLLSLPKLVTYWRAYRIRGRAGTAGWASRDDLKKAGIFRKKGFFIGAQQQRPAFVEIESSGLVLSAAGGGKTTCFVIPALCHNPMSMIVLDLKRTLAPMTARMRQKYHRNKIIILDPAQGGARYNPLHILIDDWARPEHHCHLLDDCRAISMQLCPEPAHGGENIYFRHGSRKLLVFAFVYDVTTQFMPTLANALNLLSVNSDLLAALRQVETSTILGGDFSRLAKDLLKKLEEGDPRQIESFREGAVQALQVFASSGVLAQSTSGSDFRFYDLRRKKTTLYLVADPTRINVYRPWLGLLSWCALTELLRHSKGGRVCMLCDEVTNFKIEGLPAMLTLAREYGVVLWLIMQELEQWAYVYGRESLETLLSQSEAKIFMDVRSHKATQLISDMLGEQSIKTMNHNLGASFFDPVTRSMQESGRRLMTPDEVRRSRQIILFYRKLRPVLLTQAGYHEVHPWKNRVGINPLVGKKYKGKTKVRV